MKLSIWQQFSSNHSTSFTVVGTFETEESAERAAAEMQQTLNRIIGWWDQLPVEDRKAPHPYDIEATTAIEQQIGEEYGVAWPFSILNWYGVEDAQPQVHRLESRVFVEEPHGFLRRGPQPIPDLMAKLGGAVDLRVDESLSYPETILVMDVTCTLPAEEGAAKRIYQEFNADFEAFWTLDFPEFGAYNRKVELPFDILVDLLPVGEELHLFEVERQGMELILRGIWLDTPDGARGNIVCLREYLEAKGCSDVAIAFRTLRNFKWPEQDS